MASRMERIEIWLGITQRCDENRAKSHFEIEGSGNWRFY